LEALASRPNGTLEKSSRPPSLILLDFDLPRMRAPEVIAALRACPWTRFVPIVIFSDSQASKDIKASYESGANGFVCKPVDFSEFQEAVRALGRYWLEVNQHPP
jgi:DNA-binding response OmpR family regulator